MPRRPDLARRASLARNAVDVLRARGLQTPMRTLAGALGVKRPTLYFYFPDLGSIFDTAVENADQSVGEAVLARTRESSHGPHLPSHPVDRLRVVIEATLALHRERPELVAGLVLRWALGGEGSTAVERCRRALQAARDGLVADLRAGIARREVRPCDAERIVDLVLTWVEGALLQQVLGFPRGDDGGDELVRRVLEPLRLQRKRRRGRA
jgi:AcrR family transcriptional regulator